MVGDVGTSVWMLGGIGGRVPVIFRKGAVFSGIGGPEGATTELLELGKGKKPLCGMTRGGPRCLFRQLRSRCAWPILDARLRTVGDRRCTHRVQVDASHELAG